jgi:hypothetical protein
MNVAWLDQWASGHKFLRASYTYPDIDISTLFDAGKFCKAEKDIKFCKPLGWKEIKLEEQEIFSSFHVAHNSV